MIAGFFTKNISAIAAKLSLIVGLSFYLTCTFIVSVDLHFVHIWGIEFILNMIVMFTVSYFYPSNKVVEEKDTYILDLSTWKYTKHLSAILCLVTILIYIGLGTYS